MDRDARPTGREGPVGPAGRRRAPGPVPGEALSDGIALFNRGEYFHAHERWEHLWMRVEGVDAQALQALIQVAAALVKLRQGNLRGLHLNWGKAESRLQRLPPVWEGIYLVALASTMRELLADPDTAAWPLLWADLERAPEPHGQEGPRQPGLQGEARARGHEEMRSSTNHG